MAAQASVQVVKGAVDIVKILPHLKAIKDAMDLGASFSQAVALSNTVFQGGRLTVIGAEGAAVAGTTLAVSLSTKLLGGFGAVIGVAAGADPGKVKWVNFHPPFSEPPSFFFSYHSNIDLKYLNQALILLHYYKNSPPISKSWIRACADAIYSWVTKNPNRASAEDLLPKVKANLKSLKEMKESFEQLQKI